jgi:hypothetical protein
MSDKNFAARNSSLAIIRISMNPLSITDADAVG